jgi:hypothetical protein
MLPLFLSALLSLRSFREKWAPPLKTFSILLLTIFFVEAMALLWKYYFVTLPNWPYSKSNLWLYNSFLVPQYLLYLAVYYRVIASPLLKRVIVALAVLFTLFAIVNILFIQDIHSINSYTLAFASCIVIFLTVAYFEQLRKQEEVIRLTDHPMVWISLGAFVYHAADLPYLLGLNYLIRTNVALAVALFYIYLALNCVMYSLYTIAFLCKPRLHK